MVMLFYMIINSILIVFLQDILDFIDQGCNGFLSDITLVIASYNELFFAKKSDE